MECDITRQHKIQNSPQTESCFSFEKCSINETGGKIAIDHYLSLEKKEGDIWVPVTQYGGMIETAGTLPAGSSFRQKVDIVSLFGGYLAVGEYRVSKNYSRENIVQPQYVCTAYFTVTSVEN